MRAPATRLTTPRRAGLRLTPAGLALAGLTATGLTVACGGPPRRPPAGPPAPAPVAAAPPAPPPPPGPAAAVALDSAALTYAGHTRDGRPRYVGEAFSADDRQALLQAYGIDDPSRLYLPDSSPGAILRYDLRVPAPLPLGNEHLLTARVGYPSARRRGETWDAFAARVMRMPASAFPAGVRQVVTSLDALEPDARAGFAQLLADARRAGFVVRLNETRRTPERQAYLLARGPARTLTLTSAHMTGRAADVIVGDGNIARAATRKQWVAFRRWAEAYGGGRRFRLIGTPEKTWDWAHLELADDPHGFRSIDDALAAAHNCAGDLLPDGDAPCLPETRALAEGEVVPRRGPPPRPSTRAAAAGRGIRRVE